MKLRWSRNEDWLEGLTFLDFSSLLPCPFATQLLCDLGARVIKIESPQRPNPARGFGAAPPEGPPGYAYREVNRGKELVFLDLKVPENRAQLHELVRQADGGIQGYRPEVGARLGIDYESLHAVNPMFVMCNVSGFNAQSPIANRPGHDIGFVARSGILDQTRDLGGTPVMPGVPIADIAVAYSAALQLLAAVVNSKKRGVGRNIYVSIEEALIDIQRPFLKEQIELMRSGAKVKAGETLVTGEFPCYSLYHLDGGTLSVGALEEKYWLLFINAIGLNELKDARLYTGEKGQKAKHAVHGALKQKSFTHWCSTFETLECCVEPVFTLHDVAKRVEGGL